MRSKGDPINRGRMQAPLEEWEREAEERLHRRVEETAHQTAAQAVAVAPEQTVPQSEKAESDVSKCESGPIEKDIEDRSEVPVQETEEKEKEPLDQTDMLQSDAEEVVRADAEEESSSADDVQSGSENAEPVEESAKPSLKKNGAGMAVRLAAQWVIFAVFLLVVLADTFDYPLPSSLRLLREPFALFVTEAGLFVLASLFAAPVLGNGFLTLFRLQPKTSSATAVAFLGGVAGFAPAFLKGGSVQAAVPYALSACACMALETLSQVLFASARHTSETAARQLTGCRMAFVKRLVIGSSGHKHMIVAPGKAAPPEMPQDDLAPTGRATSVVSLLMLLASVGMACVCIYLFKRSLTQSILLAAGLASIGTPLVMGVCVGMPFYGTALALKKRGAVLSGFGAVRTFGEVDAVFLPERLLYPEGKIKVCALRPMCENGLEDAVLMAASVATAARTAMAPAFLHLFEGGESLLRPVGCLNVIDEIGMEAWVDGQQVLLGSRNLLRQKQIDLTGRMLLEVEAKYAVKGNDFVYLVVNGVPTALFVLDYIPDKKIRSALRVLAHTGVHLLIGTADANITREQVAEQFALKKRMLKILPRQKVEAIVPPEEQSDIVPRLYIPENAVSFARALAACVRLDSTAHAVAVLQVIGAVAGVSMAAGLYILFGWMLQPLEVLAVEIIWAVPPLLLSVFRRHV